MLYTIDIEDFNLLYRLDENNVFIDVSHRENKEILPGDKTFDSYQSAKISKLKLGLTILVEGKEVNCNEDSYTLGEPYVTINLHRTDKPKQLYFTKEQLQKVLYLGNDNEHNRLVIDFDGFIHLNPLKKKSEGLYAVSYEVFAAGNGYVGQTWSATELQDLYDSLIQGWHRHLLYGETVYVDCSNGSSSEDNIKAILDILK